MKEGKLSSAYLKRFDLNETQNCGKVLWHTLTENGKMELYDMKFGDTIVANIPADEIIPTLFETHGAMHRDELKESSKSHGARGPSHKSRAKAIKKARK
jgi:hypothetical protein